MSEKPMSRIEQIMKQNDQKAAKLIERAIRSIAGRKDVQPPHCRRCPKGVVY